MRFVAAQFAALLDRRPVAAQRRRTPTPWRPACTSGCTTSPGVELDGPPAVNSLFPRLPKDAIERLRAWCFFYDWDPAAQQVRWMTSFDTTEDDVERFAAGVRAALD